MNSAKNDSINILCELLFLVFNAVLFQRGLYSRTQFVRARKWDLPVMITSSPGLSEYLANAVSQIRSHWLIQSDLEELLHGITLIILNNNDRAVERWQFDLTPTAITKDILNADIKADLQKLMRQVGVTVTFLPILKEKHTFRIAISEQSGNHGFTQCPEDWIETHFRAVDHPEEGEFQKIFLSHFIVQLKVVYNVDNEAI